MLRRVWANVREVGHGEVVVRVVIPKKCLHLRSLVDNGHNCEVTLVVPPPGDAERKLLEDLAFKGLIDGGGKDSRTSRHGTS